MSAEQAYAICFPQADLAGVNAARNQRARSNSSNSFGCIKIGRNYSCDDSLSLSGGGKWGGLKSAWDARSANDSTYRAVMDACLAQYGWRD